MVRNARAAVIDYRLCANNGPIEPGAEAAKGISEVATVPITPAIINAIYHAVGVRITNLPATKERVLEGLRRERPSTG